MSQKLHMEVSTIVFSFLFYFCLNLCFCAVKAGCCVENEFKISKETAQKYQQLLEDKKEYIVLELLDMRQSNDGELEFLTKLKGYTDDHKTWEQIATFNILLSEW